MKVPLRKSRVSHPNCDVFHDYLDRRKYVVGSVWKPHNRKTWTATILLDPVPQDKINEHATIARRLGQDFKTQEDAETALWKRYRQYLREKAHIIAKDALDDYYRNQFPVAINSEVNL